MTIAGIRNKHRLPRTKVGIFRAELSPSYRREREDAEVVRKRALLVHEDRISSGRNSATHPHTDVRQYRNAGTLCGAMNDGQPGTAVGCQRDSPLTTVT